MIITIPDNWTTAHTTPAAEQGEGVTKLIAKLEREADAWEQWAKDHPGDGAPTTVGALREAVRFLRGQTDS